MFPESTLTRRLVGTYTRPDGTAFRGQVRFNLTVMGLDKTPDALVHYPAVDITCQLDYQGRFAVQLLCTDDFDLQPDNVVYHVYEQFPGGRNYYIWLPYGPGTEIDIMDLAPPSPPVAMPDDGSGITKHEADARYVNVEGDIMDGPLTLLHYPQDQQTATHKQYVDETVSNYYMASKNELLRIDGSNQMTEHLNVGNFKAINVADPVDGTDATNKQTSDAYAQNVGYESRAYTDTEVSELRTESKTYVDAEIQETKDYADAVGVAATEIVVSATQPPDPNDFKLWVTP